MFDPITADEATFFSLDAAVSIAVARFTKRGRQVVRTVPLTDPRRAEFIRYVVKDAPR